jgi:hypothetical protein
MELHHQRNRELAKVIPKRFCAFLPAQSFLYFTERVWFRHACSAGATFIPDIETEPKVITCQCYRFLTIYFFFIRFLYL